MGSLLTSGQIGSSDAVSGEDLDNIGDNRHTQPVANPNDEVLGSDISSSEGGSGKSAVFSRSLTPSVIVPTGLLASESVMRSLQSQVR